MCYIIRFCKTIVKLYQQIHFVFLSSITLDPNRIIFFVPTRSLLTGQLLCLCSELRGALFRNRFRSQTWSWLYSRLVQLEADKTVPRNAPIAQVQTGRKSKKKKKKKAPSWIRSTCDLFGRLADEWDQTIDVLATHSLRFDPIRSTKRRPVAAFTGNRQERASITWTTRMVKLKANRRIERRLLK